MKESYRSQSMLSSVNNGVKHSGIAYQYIQADIDKMSSMVSNIEQTANRLIPLVPPNLQNDISSLKKKSQQLFNSYSAFDYDKYTNKLKITKDSLDNLNEKIISHINNNSETNQSKSFADVFYNDVTNRILNTTKQQCSNLEFCVDSELRALSKKSETSPLNNNILPQFDTPAPKKLVVHRKQASLNEKEKIIYAIKDQAKRLSDIYSQIVDLKSLQKGKTTINSNTSLRSLSKLQEDNTRILSELEMQYNILNIKNNSKSKKAKEKNVSDADNKSADVLMKNQRDSFESLSESMIQSAKKKFEEAKNKVKEEIQMIRARLEILENKINEYGDFSGETNEMMTYVEMKVDQVIQDNDDFQGEGNLNEDQKSTNLTNIYLDVRARVAKSAIESQLESLKRSIRYVQFHKPLI